MDTTIKLIAVKDGTIFENLKLLGLSAGICTQLRKSADFVLYKGNPSTLLDLINTGEEFLIIIEDNPIREIPPADIPVDIIYEDDHLAVIDKQPQLAVISTRVHYGKSLENALANIWGNFVYRPINRLDLDTSGLMIVAKNRLSACLLKDIPIYKEYRALVYGKLEGSGVIDAPIARDSDSIIKRKISKDGQTAKTEYTSICHNADYSLVKLVLHTGRTHQIRLHMSSIGHPICGDTLYGEEFCKKESPFPTQCLHSYKLCFEHPVLRKPMSFVSNKAYFLSLPFVKSD